MSQVSSAAHSCLSRITRSGGLTRGLLTVLPRLTVLPQLAVLTLLTMVTLLTLLSWNAASAQANEPPLQVAQADGEPLQLKPLGSTGDPLLNQPAPDFSLQQRNGETLSLTGLKGKVVVLNFWATWCAPCVEEIPALNRLYRQLKGLPVELVGISVDNGWAEVDKMLLKRPIQFKVALDTAQGVPTRYGTSKYPETFVINKQGVVVRKLIGAQLWDRGDFVAYLRKLAAE